MNDEYLNGEAVEGLPVLTLNEARESLRQALMDLCVSQNEVLGAVTNLAEAVRRENADVSDFADKVGTIINNAIESMTAMAGVVGEIRDFGGQA